MLITIGVWAAGTGYVHFGILHLIGFSIIAAYPFLRFRWLNLFLWILFVAAFTGAAIRDARQVSARRYNVTRWPFPGWSGWA